MTHPEHHLQKQVCAYLSAQYPSVLFLSTGTSLKLTKGQANRNKAIQKDGFKCPDLLILKPVGKWSGLFLELKVESPFKRNGEIKASQNDHLKKQQQAMEDLTLEGYFATFAWSFDHAKKIIDNYLGGKL